MRTGRAVALLAVAVLVALLLLGHVGSTRQATTVSSSATTVAPTTTVPAPAATTTTSLPAVPPAQVKLLVLNGTGAGNLAGSTSRRLAADPGYNTLAPDDTIAKVAASAIYAVTPQYLGSAQALASFLHLPASSVQSGLPTSAPVRSTERTIADVILVIGPDLPAATGAGTGTGTATTSAG